MAALPCAAAIAAPWLAAHGQALASALLYAAFAPLCHQMPQRSFFWHDRPWAVCHRCAGIYIGIAAGALVPRALTARLLGLRTRRLWLLGAAAPLLVDSLLPAAGLWSNTAASRCTSGAALGVMLGSILVAGLAELPAELRRAGIRRRTSPSGDGS